MKKLSFTLIAGFFALISITAEAQFTVSPNPASNNGLTPSPADVVANSTITNESDQPITVSWHRTIHALPDGWTTAVCDIVQCRFEWVDSEEFVLEGSSQGNIDVHFYPDGTWGEAIVEVQMVDEAFPLDTTDVFFLFNETLSVTEKFEQHIKLYPNPTVDRLTIEAGHEVHAAEIYGTDGRQIQRKVLNGNREFDVSALPKAAYVIRLLDAQGRSLSSSIVIKK